MASLRLPALRHLAACPPPSPRAALQRRWAQVHDIRFLATTQPRKSITDKYHERLQQRARTEGLASVEQLKAAYADKIDEQRRRDAVPPTTIPQSPETPVKQPNHGPLDPPPPPPQPRDPDGGDGGEPTTIPQAPDTPVKQPNRDPEQPPQTPAKPAASARSGGKAAVQTLDDILDLPKARELPEKELTAIWRLRHASSPQRICAVIPAPTYQAMEDAARAAPQFVLPVPHEGQGAEIHFLQWTFDEDTRTSTVMFTQLAEYKARGEFAQPHTTVTHHLDLADDRGLVLMQGQVVEGRGVLPEQARWLVLCLQRFYGGWEGDVRETEGQRAERAAERKRLLHWFANGDARFSVEKLLEEAERMG